MKKENINGYMQVFVCNHKRDDEECCFDKDSKALTDDLKKWAKEETNKEIRIFRSGCLGQCSQGIAMACFPQKEFTLNVKKEDAGEIKKGLKEALSKLKS